MDEYYNSLATSAADYDSKKANIADIYHEIDAFSKELCKFTMERNNVKIMLQRHFIDDPMLSGFEKVAVMMRTGIGNKNDAMLRPYLCFVNEYGAKKHVAFFELSDGGYPIVAKFGNDEKRIKNIEAVRQFFKDIAKTFLFFDSLANFIQKTKDDLATRELESAEQKKSITGDNELPIQGE